MQPSAHPFSIVGSPFSADFQLYSESPFRLSRRSRSSCCTLMFAIIGSSPGRCREISIIVPGSIGLEKAALQKALNLG